MYLGRCSRFLPVVETRRSASRVLDAFNLRQGGVTDDTVDYCILRCICIGTGTGSTEQRLQCIANLPHSVCKNFESTNLIYTLSRLRGAAVRLEFASTYCVLRLDSLETRNYELFSNACRMVYDNLTRTSSDSPGVRIRVPGFGNTSTVEVLDSNEVRLTKYFKDIADAAVKWGYRRNKDIRGAPYDFRKAPSG